MRRTAAVSVMAAGLAFAACGSDAGSPASKRAPGTPENPQVAARVDAATLAKAKARGHLNEAKGSDQQATSETADPAQRPCSLVSADEARTILGVAIRKPVLAPQGPTCVYRPKSSSATFVTVAIGPLDRAQLKSQIPQLQKVTVSGRTGYCARTRASTLIVPVAGDRLLTIGASCKVARAFAAKAIPAMTA